MKNDFDLKKDGPKRGQEPENTAGEGLSEKMQRIQREVKEKLERLKRKLPEDEVSDSPKKGHEPPSVN